MFFQYTHNDVNIVDNFDSRQEKQSQLSNHEDEPVENLLPVENMTIKKYAANELSDKVFVTPEERYKLFESLGIEYLFEEIFAYEHALPIDIQDNDIYKESPELHKGLSFLYADDIKDRTLVPMSIRWLGDEIGYGIFAEKDLYEDDFIGVYTGVVQDRASTQNKDYAWQYPTLTDDGYTMVVDGSTKGNELRFINDGVNPNCVVRYIIGKDNLWHVCYTALKDVKKGEQLLISYGPAYWDTRIYKYKELADIK